MNDRRRFGRLDARLACPQDDAFLAELYRAARPDLGALPVPAAVIDGIAHHQRRLRDADYARRYPEAARWIVEEGGRAVAWIVLAARDGDRRVVDLAVAPAARRQGVARTLLRALQEEGCPIALRVRAGNTAARALYAALGFATVGGDGAALELRWNCAGAVREPAATLER